MNPFRPLVTRLLPIFGVFWGFLLISCVAKRDVLERCEDAVKLCESEILKCDQNQEKRILECGCGCFDLSKPPMPNPKIKRRAQKDTISIPEPGVSTRVTIDALPPSDRVFVLDEDGDGVDELFGVKGRQLWRFSTKTSELTQESLPGRGVVQMMTVGQWGGRRHIFAASGRGRGVQAPVRVHARASNTPKWQDKSLVQETSTRNDISDLRVLPPQSPFAGQLLVSFFSSKYMVKSVVVSPEGVTPLNGPERMAMQVLPWRSGNSAQDWKVTGRLYGDKKGQSGDLKLTSLRNGGASSRIDVDHGIRSLTLGRTTRSSFPRLYVADGWLAEYKAKAKAQLREVRFEDGRFENELVGTSASEYTFFEIWARDLDRDGQEEILARGDQYLTFFKRTAKGWRQKRLGSFEPVLNVGLLYGGDLGWVVVVPNAEGTRTTILDPKAVTL